MIKKDDYSEIIQRIKHIKSLFAFGEGILPFLEELFVFLREVTPLLNEVSESIMNTTGMMPDAAVELDSAVEQTSDATYLIMDHVEKIMANLDALEEQLKNSNVSAGSLDILNETKMDSMSIMNALQFHDIVSQKLVHVRKVLAEIQQKMLTLFTRVYDLQIDQDVKENILSTFGVNMDEFEKLIDSKIETDHRMTADIPHPKDRNKPEKRPPATFSQNDIDDLFG